MSNFHDAIVLEGGPVLNLGRLLSTLPLEVVERRDKIKAAAKTTRPPAFLVTISSGSLDKATEERFREALREVRGSSDGWKMPLIVDQDVSVESLSRVDDDTSHRAAKRRLRLRAPIFYAPAGERVLVTWMAKSAPWVEAIPYGLRYPGLPPLDEPAPGRDWYPIEVLRPLNATARGLRRGMLRREGR